MITRIALSVVVFWAVSPAFGQSVEFDNSEVARQSRNQEHLLNLFTVGGRPKNGDAAHKVKILINRGYAVGYSEERRNPLWSLYRASKISRNSTPFRYERVNFFAADTRVNPAVDGRTFGGDYDRGHQTPNAVIGNQYGSLAQMETFFMTNMCPQKAALNQGAWKRLEEWIIKAAQKKKHVFVICGPIFGDNPEIVTKGKERGIQIPDAFYMILLDAEKEYEDVPEIHLLAYRFPQNTASNADFKDRVKFGASINDIEKATGLNFFPDFEKRFADWNQKEAEKVMTHWSIGN